MMADTIVATVLEADNEHEGLKLLVTALIRIVSTIPETQLFAMVHAIKQIDPEQQKIAQIVLEAIVPIIGMKVFTIDPKHISG